MERVLTPEEKIKRAEEIYYNRRRVQDLNRNNRINVSKQRDFNILKKMIIQIFICIIIYLSFNFIKTKNNIFSQDVINKMNELLSSDVDLKYWYDKGMDYLDSIKNNMLLEKDNAENISQAYDIKIKDQIVKKAEETIEIIEENTIQSVGGENVEVVENENISQMEKDAKDIIATKSLIIPLIGTITSRYGYRDSNNPIVSKYHTGIDIAVNEGTEIIASMEGTVKTASSVGAYGNHIEIENGDVVTLYAHCKSIYVKEGDVINQGQKIAQVGSTGNATGPHLHFEVKKEDRYVDPDLLLQFN